jgi:cobalt-zinc-cadmium efflux system protein
VTGHAPRPTSAAGRHAGRLAAVLAITLGVLLAQVVGAAVSGSLALLADAGHLLTDVVGLAVALAAVVVARRPSSARHSYGNYRLEILAALANGLLLLAVCALVTIEALRRLAHPPTVHPLPMLVLGLVAMAAGVVSAGLLREGQRDSLNLRGAYLEVLSDVIGAAAVCVAAVVIAVTGWDRADAVASLAIAVLILPRAVTLLGQALHVLFEGTPPGVDLDDLRRHLVAVPGVTDVHDLHVWAITSGMPVLSAHVVVDDTASRPACGADGVLDRLAACVGDHFDVDHTTFQIEPASHGAHEHAAHD